MRMRCETQTEKQPCKAARSRAAEPAHNQVGSKLIQFCVQHACIGLQATDTENMCLHAQVKEGHVGKAAGSKAAGGKASKAKQAAITPELEEAEAEEAAEAIEDAAEERAELAAEAVGLELPSRLGKRADSPGGETDAPAGLSADEVRRLRLASEGPEMQGADCGRLRVYTLDHGVLVELSRHELSF